ncbi:MAG: cupin domain-containing protein [Deltaproteobacteria bacterium]|nr:cupin domain-containing protein [Deltaproteobacteria bacterium]
MTREIALDPDRIEWAPTPFSGCHIKYLHRDEGTGASIALLRFEKGAGIPRSHVHGSNQFMIMLKGRYEYTSSGITLTEGMFYMNPKGHPHGPTTAHEECLMVEIYDGPHYPEEDNPWAGFQGTRP